VISERSEVAIETFHGRCDRQGVHGYGVRQITGTNSLHSMRATEDADA